MNAAAGTIFVCTLPPANPMCGFRFEVLSLSCTMGPCYIDLKVPCLCVEVLRCGEEACVLVCGGQVRGMNETAT